MIRLLPRSLFGQALLVLLAGLALSLVIGGWIYIGDREQAVRAVGGFAVAQRVANITRLIEESPPDWRDRIAAAASDPSFRISIAGAPPTFPIQGKPNLTSGIIQDFLVGQLSGGSARQVLVAASGESTPQYGMAIDQAHSRMPADQSMAMGSMMHIVGAWRRLWVAIELHDGKWLAFATALPDAGPAMSWQLILSLATMALIIVLATAWAVRRVTAPLATLATAAQRLGRDLNAPPLAARGTVEMRQAAQAFNEMQERLRRLIENRTRLLAAISHDLRTPLTLLRLRAENATNEEDREKMVATIATMDAMIEASLKFARGDTTTEPRRPVDLAALLTSTVDEMADAGLAVTMAPARELIYPCQAEAVKRAVTNLIDNAVKYGKTARARLETTPKAATIVVEDDGPGIPEAELSRVVQPFYRLDQSRSAETGGIGLGLAIALSVGEAHGGTLTLSNRSEGGLHAELAFPLASGDEKRASAS